MTGTGHRGGTATHRLRRTPATATLLLLLLLVACGGPGTPERAGTTDTTVSTSAAQMTLTSPAFADREAIPAQYSFRGANTSPPLAWTAVPSTAAALALVVEDPDAPGGSAFVHWTVWDFPADPGEVTAGVVPAGGIEGANSSGGVGYIGPDPPPDETHRYVFTLYALSERLELTAGTDPEDLRSALEGRTTARATLTGLYPGSE